MMLSDANKCFCSQKRVDHSVYEIIPQNSFEVYPREPPDLPVNILLSNIKRESGGTFGEVYRANLFLIPEHQDSTHHCCTTPSETVAVKTVLQNERFKNRELEITRMMNHPNIVQMKYYFKRTKNESTYLGIIMDYYPLDFHSFVKDVRIRKVIPDESVLKNYAFQLISGINYIHNMNICHRDIKPHNILLSADRKVLRICDFGSAKTLEPNGRNISYICSRYYRAPELIVGVTDYTTSVDIWSCGCVLAEAYSGVVLFYGDSTSNQLRAIFSKLELPESYIELLPQKDPEKIIKHPPIKGALNKHLQCKFTNYVDLVEEMTYKRPIVCS
ncbi:Glycogen synthase kinase-3 beta [Thelohanellus kitauei]|uniref:Glycogen synthase kinase-3 beta n=1 Tax=Thelohanellus kitauei TaxID=669202 RepID=A0A0C2MHA3_THEKT|nr:Glycogen synthase kinase-3 beta [Thelohanellus kitauei]